MDALADEAAGSDPAGRLAALLAQLRALHGDGFVALPRVKPADPQILDKAKAATTAFGVPAQHGVESWLARLARVRPGMAAAETVRTCVELLGRRLDPVPTQLPLPASGTQVWLGVPNGVTSKATTSLVLLGGVPTAGADGSLGGLVIDEWTETIPNAQITAGLTFHFDAPGAQAPQTILLAVPPAPDRANWTLEDLEAAVLHAAELARARVADPADIPELAPFLPAVHVTGGITAPQLFTPPQGYGIAETSGAPAITRVDGQKTLVQGAQNAVLTVVGSNLAGGTYQLLGGGVTLLSAVNGVLTVRVDAGAAVGPRTLQVDTAYGRAQFAVSVSAVPMLTGVAPASFLQQIGVDTVVPVTVTGQALPLFTEGSVRGGPVTVAIVSTGETSVQLNLRVAGGADWVSDWDPTEPGGPLKPPRRPPLQHDDVPLVLSLKAGAQTLEIGGMTLTTSYYSSL
jgi:hypothetical protein